MLLKEADLDLWHVDTRGRTFAHYVYWTRNRILFNLLLGPKAQSSLPEGLREKLKNPPRELTERLAHRTVLPHTDFLCHAQMAYEPPPHVPRATYLADLREVEQTMSRITGHCRTTTVPAGSPLFPKCPLAPCQQRTKPTICTSGGLWLLFS